MVRAPFNRIYKGSFKGIYRSLGFLEVLGPRVGLGFRLQAVVA